MTATTLAPAQRVDDQALQRGAAATLLHGLRLVPEFREGLLVTLLLALLATAGRVVVPVAVQQTIDKGLSGPVPDTGLVRTAVLLAGAAVLVTAFASYRMNVRLYRATEGGLAALRVRAFRRVHDLSVLHQATERRGSLVSRVTGDVDTISTFMQWGGLLIVVSTAQMLLATALMLFWSWQLTLLVYVCFLPLFLAVRHLQQRLQSAYRLVRERVGELLGAVAESVVGAPVIRAHAVEARTAARIDDAVEKAKSAQVARPDDRGRHVLLRRADGRARQRRGGRRRACSSASTGRSRPAGWSASCSSSRCSCSPCRSRPRCSTRRRTRSPACGASSACSTRRPTSPTRRGRRGPAGRAGRRCASRACRSPTRAGRRCCTASTSRSRRARGSPSSGRPAAARPRSPSCSPA